MHITLQRGLAAALAGAHGGKLFEAAPAQVLGLLHALEFTSRWAASTRVTRQRTDRLHPLQDIYTQRRRAPTHPGACPLKAAPRAPPTPGPPPLPSARLSHRPSPLHPALRPQLPAAAWRAWPATCAPGSRSWRAATTPGTRCCRPRSRCAPAGRGPPSPACPLRCRGATRGPHRAFERAQNGAQQCRGPAYQFSRIHSFSLNPTARPRAGPLRVDQQPPCCSPSPPGDGRRSDASVQRRRGPCRDPARVTARLGMGEAAAFLRGGAGGGGRQGARGAAAAAAARAGSDVWAYAQDNNPNTSILSP